MSEAPQAHHALFWRRLAHWGASRGPEWWVRYSPPAFGWAAAALVPSARRAVLRNLRQIRGPAPPFTELRDVLLTFSAYASCFAEVLSNDAARGPRPPSVAVSGARRVEEALALGKGVIMVTAHTAGWEAVGPMVARDHGVPMTLVMHAEADAGARGLQDGARRRGGISIVHTGDDPLAALPLLRLLGAGGVVALQLDRVAPGMRAREVELLGRRQRIPEGPLLLAELSGAPILPVFCARTGHRRYVVELFESRALRRRAPEAERAAVGQHLADCLSTFLRAHPTQWFHFGA
jgi:KDO2-lipid IV(A) lauroyltransferase